MIVYKMKTGQATDLRFVFEPEADDIIFGEGDTLPDIETLHDASYITIRKEAEARGYRDELLRCSDCKMLEDHPTGKKQEWKTYRQALRDVPSQVGFPDNITWPTKPG